jgi:alkylation response protein AidB-like acyl-CoA dehydrogenase
MGFGLEMIGPTLLNFGTEEQKREHLTQIARGEIRWCQGYSEPDSGRTSRRCRRARCATATTSS